MRKKFTLLSIALFLASSQVFAITLSSNMEKVITACQQLPSAAATANADQMRNFSKTVKLLDIGELDDMRLEKGTEISLDNHLLFDDEFVDSLIVNRKVINYASKYAKRRSNRGSSRGASLKMTTKALKGNSSATWKMVRRGDFEMAVVGEYNARFTVTVFDEKGKVIYTEKVNNKKGEPVRRISLKLPDKGTRINVKVQNTTGTDSSFAIITNR